MSLRLEDDGIIEEQDMEKAFAIANSRSYRNKAYKRREKISKVQWKLNDADVFFNKASLNHNIQLRRKYFNKQKLKSVWCKMENYCSTGETRWLEFFRPTEVAQVDALVEKEEVSMISSSALKKKKKKEKEKDSNSKFKNKKNKQTRTRFDPNKRRYRSCPCCMCQFAAESLTGVVSRQSILRLRHKWAVRKWRDYEFDRIKTGVGERQPIPVEDEAMGRYDQLRICLFCTQFFPFDDDFSGDKNTNAKGFDSNENNIFIAGANKRLALEGLEKHLLANVDTSVVVSITPTQSANIFKQPRAALPHSPIKKKATSLSFNDNPKLIMPADPHSLDQDLQKVLFAKTKTRDINYLASSSRFESCPLITSDHCSGYPTPPKIPQTIKVASPRSHRGRNCFCLQGDTELDSALVSRII